MGRVDVWGFPALPGKLEETHTWIWTPESHWAGVGLAGEALGAVTVFMGDAVSYSYRCNPGRAPPNSSWSPEGSPLSPKSKALKFKMREERRRQDRKSRIANHNVRPFCFC